jgi:protein-L-isoaspartate(D-aspartate) O-methyltransferase
MIESEKNRNIVLRDRMIKTQIEARGISNASIIDAMRKVERHKFVPVNLRRQAYSDHPLPLPGGQTISQPYIVAFMTDAVSPQCHDRVLEIGTGSGYQAAVLAELCKVVYSIEIQPGLAEYAIQNLESAGYSNVFVKACDGVDGWINEAPFDIIIVTCGASNIPEPLTKQLAEGGRMIVPIDSYWSQELILARKRNNVLQKKEILPVRFVPMVNQNGKKY